MFFFPYPVFEAEAVEYDEIHSGIQLDTAKYVRTDTAGYSGIQRDTVDLLQNG